MKILFTSTYFHPYLSGLTDYPLKTATYLSKKYDVSVLTYCFDKRLLALEQYNNITINRLPFHLKISKGFINFFYPFISLWYVLKNDLIFVNLPQAEGKFPAFWAWLFRKKLYCIYNCELSFPDSKMLSFIGFLVNVSSFIACLLAHKVIVYTKDYALNSPFLKLIPGKLVEVFPPVAYVEPGSTYIKTLSELSKNRRPVLGFSGRVSKEKGLEYLLEALVLLLKKYPRLLFFCAGPYGKDVAGENAYFKKIEQLVVSKKLPVIFLGTLSKEQLFSFYHSIDLLVLPSVNSTEAFGMVQVEAMLSGKPVVASNLKGVRIPILKTNMGMLANPGDSKDLAVKIENVLSDKKKYKALRQSAQSIFAIERTYKFFDSLVES